jgi:hypothetical protein
LLFCTFQTPNDDAADEQIEKRASLMRAVEELQEDCESLEIFKNSGLKSSQLKVFVTRLADQASTLDETLLLDTSLEETERVNAEKIVKLASKKAGGLLRAFAVLPDDESEAGSSQASHKKASNYLRKLDLPKFKGNIKEWTQWWSRFRSSVNTDPSYDDGLKLQYFEDAMEEEALAYLHGFALAPENYSTIIEEFQTRFSNVDLLSQAYHQDLEAIPECFGSWKEQRVVWDEIVKIVSNLKAIGVEVNEGNVRSLIMRKFPENTLLAAYYESMFMQVCAASSSTSVNLATSMESLRLPLDTLLEALRRALLKQEFIAQSKGELGAPASSTVLIGKTNGGGHKTNKGSGGSHSRGGNGGSSSGGKMQRPKEQSKTPHCVLCERDHHRAVECRTYRTLTERKARLAALRRCFICLNTGHQSLVCSARKNCSECRRGFHHPAICYDTIQKLSKPRNELSGSKRKELADTTSRKSGTFLQTFMCIIVNGERCCTTRGVLDNGSDTSYISSDLIRRLNIKPGPTRTLGLQTFASHDAVSIAVQDVSVTISNMSGSRKVVTFVTTNNIVGRCQLAPPPHTVVKLLPANNKYADSDIFKSDPRAVELLIGSDAYYDFVHLNGHTRLDNGVVLLQSFFGWIPAGCGDVSKSSCPQKRKITSVLAASVSSESAKQVDSGESREDHELNEQLTQLWSLEALGIKPQELEDKSEAVLKSFADTTRIEDGRYVVRWPRKKENFSLPTNYRMCMTRLKSNTARMSEELRLQLHEHFKLQEKEGIIERAPLKTHHIVHYLPYKTVIRNDKLRVVYDASAKTKSGLALNDVLHAGPSIVKDIVGLLFGYRMNPTAVLADIEKAFLRIGLDEADRDMVRFLAVADPLKPVDPKALVVYRFCRVPFGVISSPFLMNMVLQELLTAALSSAEGSDAKWCALGRISFYVDNLLLSVEDATEALQLYDVLTHHFALAGFNLRDWASNSAEFSSAIPAEMAASTLGPISVLGMNWDRGTDELSLKFDSTQCLAKVTKRVALQILAAVFDPLGVFAPCLLNLKLFIQECWILGLAWDADLPAILETRFRKLKTERDSILTVSFPRHLWTSTVHNCDFVLHVFCDASKRAFGCAHYLVKMSRKAKQNEAALLFSKVKLAPRKIRPVNQLKEKPSRPLSKAVLKKAVNSVDLDNERSIPQLELLGASLAAKTSLYVLAQLRERGAQVLEVFIWTDATTVLQWLHTISVLPLFVENRLKDIRSVSNLTVRHVPTKSNPADYLTRGKLAVELQDDSLWWKGPSWLTQERLWPNPPTSAPVYKNTSATTLLTKVVNRFLVLTDSLEKRYSLWSTYVRWFSDLRKKIFCG